MEAENRPPKGRKLNVDGIKRVIVFLVAIFDAVVSAFTGLGAQLIYAPMLVWMLGFRGEKAQGTAIQYGAFAGLAALVGLFVAGVRPVFWGGAGILLFVGATIGAVLTAKLAPKPEMTARRQLFLSMGVLVLVGVTTQTVQSNLFRPGILALWNTPLALLGLGVITGGLTRIMALPGGLLLIPALHFLSGYRPAEAIFLALFVVLLAVLLPAAAYRSRETGENGFLNPSIAGGLVGGAIGGSLLPRLPEKMPVFLFVLVAMILCGRELARIALDRLPPPQSD